MDCISFDLETEYIEGPLDLGRQVPSITVAATLTDAGDVTLWCERDSAGQVTGDTLGVDGARALVCYLQDNLRRGATIVTWNGAGFDFRVLAQASGMWPEAAALAWEHVDMMFWLHCKKGFSVALRRAAQAVGTDKTAGVSGADAPRLWAQGEYDQVLRYVTQDVQVVGAVYDAAMRRQGLRWINSRGLLSEAEGRLCSVRLSYGMPVPDTSWMRRPSWPRDKFVGWMLALSV
jgi:hypothetical protein